MTAGTLARSSQPASGLHPIDPRRDMGQVADLIEVSFHGDLDRTGRRMVREMRTLGRAGWIGWALSQLLLPSSSRPMGFVWFEAGRVIGNASLLPVAGYPTRWVMANVAVHPDHRRRGIAGELVAASDDFARRSGARTIYLQVERDNPAALALYDKADYSALTTRTTWHRPRGLTWRPVRPNRPVRIRRPNEWTQQWSLASRYASEGLVWPYPLEPDYFRGARFGGLLGGGGKRHLVAPGNGGLLGSLTVEQGRVSRFVLVVEPEVEGQIEQALVSQALDRLRGAVVMDYTSEVAKEELIALGFREKRALTWMKKLL